MTGLRTKIAVLAEKRKQDARELHKLGERSNLTERGLVGDGWSEHDVERGAVISRADRQYMAAADSQVSEPKGMLLQNAAFRACPVPLHVSTVRCHRVGNGRGSMTVSLSLMLRQRRTRIYGPTCSHAVLMHDECWSVSEF